MLRGCLRGLMAFCLALVNQLLQTVNMDAKCTLVAMTQLNSTNPYLHQH